MYRIAVIPARWGSSRFPGKPLALLNGRPMVEHVVRRCEEAGCFEKVIVATDDARVVAAVPDFAVMTSPSCATGTDRVAEVTKTLSRAEVIVNVQGDEPAVPPAALRALAGAFDDPAVELATLVRPLEAEERQNPNVVKAAVDASGYALDFSRAELPGALAHVGLYGYRRATLLQFARLPPSTRELSERLEQLRALEAGIRIRCVTTEHRARGVDAPEDITQAEEALRNL